MSRELESVISPTPYLQAIYDGPPVSLMTVLQRDAQCQWKHPRTHLGPVTGGMSPASAVQPSPTS